MAADVRQHPNFGILAPAPSAMAHPRFPSPDSRRDSGSPRRGRDTPTRGRRSVRARALLPPRRCTLHSATVVIGHPRGRATSPDPLADPHRAGCVAVSAARGALEVSIRGSSTSAMSVHSSNPRSRKRPRGDPWHAVEGEEWSSVVDPPSAPGPSSHDTAGSEKSTRDRTPSQRVKLQLLLRRVLHGRPQSLALRCALPGPAKWRRFSRRDRGIVRALDAWPG